jgi:hypothetical protein
MPPASRPAFSWVVPSVGDTVRAVGSSKDSGSAPYFKTLARSLACLCVKLPVIWVGPVMADWMTSAE